MDGSKFVHQLSRYTISEYEKAKLNPSNYQWRFVLDPRHLQFLTFRMDTLLWMQSPMTNNSGALWKRFETFINEGTESEMESAHKQMNIICAYFALVKHLILAPVSKYQIQHLDKNQQSTYVDLTCFVSVEHLELINIHPDHIIGLGSISCRLKQLKCKGSAMLDLSLLVKRPLVEEYRRRKGKSRLIEGELDAAKPQSTSQLVEKELEEKTWSNLKCLQLPVNRLCSLDEETMDMISTVSDLNLAFNAFYTIPKSLNVLSRLNSLNLSHNLLQSLSNIRQCLGHVVHLDLSFNKLLSIQGLEKLWALQTSEIYALTQLPDLMHMSIKGNPLSKRRVRAELFRKFGERQSQVLIDGKPMGFVDRLIVYPTKTIQRRSETTIYNRSVSVPDIQNQKTLARTIPSKSIGNSPVLTINSSVKSSHEFKLGSMHMSFVEQLKQDSGQDWLNLYFDKMKQQNDIKQVENPKMPIEQINDELEKEKDTFSSSSSDGESKCPNDKEDATTNQPPAVEELNDEELKKFEADVRFNSLPSIKRMDASLILAFQLTRGMLETDEKIIGWFPTMTRDTFKEASDIDFISKLKERPIYLLVTDLFVRFFSLVKPIESSMISPPRIVNPRSELSQIHKFSRLQLKQVVVGYKRQSLQLDFTNVKQFLFKSNDENISFNLIFRDSFHVNDAFSTLTSGLSVKQLDALVQNNLNFGSMLKLELNISEINLYLCGFCPAVYLSESAPESEIIPASIVVSEEPHIYAFVEGDYGEIIPLFDFAKAQLQSLTTIRDQLTVRFNLSSPPSSFLIKFPHPDNLQKLISHLSDIENLF